MHIFAQTGHCTASGTVVSAWGQIVAHDDIPPVDTAGRAHLGYRSHWRGTIVTVLAIGRRVKRRRKGTTRIVRVVVHSRWCVDIGDPSI